jgi:hypothetical protein
MNPRSLGFILVILLLVRRHWLKINSFELFIELKTQQKGALASGRANCSLALSPRALAIDPSLPGNLPGPSVRILGKLSVASGLHAFFSHV